MGAFLDGQLARERTPVRSLCVPKGVIELGHGRKIAVVDLDYVGLPIAATFARSDVPIIGFDIDHKRIAELRHGSDHTGAVEPTDLDSTNLYFTADEKELAKA